MASKRMSYAKADRHYLKPDAKWFSKFVAVGLKNKVIQKINF